jgi:hypothetical protein
MLKLSSGMFSGSLGYRNFNEELIQPQKLALANPRGTEFSAELFQ